MTHADAAALLGIDTDTSAVTTAAAAASPLSWIAPVLSAAGQLAQGGIDYADRQRAESDRAKAEEALLSQAVQVDEAAVSALHAQSLAKDDPKRVKQRAALDLAATMALGDVDRMSESLPPPLRSRRRDGAKRIADAAIAQLRLAQSSNRAGKEYLEEAAARRVEAAATVLRRIDQGPPRPESPATALVAKKSDDGGFLSRRVAGPVRVWHVGAALAAVGLGVLVGRR